MKGPSFMSLMMTVYSTGWEKIIYPCETTPFLPGKCLQVRGHKTDEALQMFLEMATYIQPYVKLQIDLKT